MVRIDADDVDFDEEALCPECGKELFPELPDGAEEEPDEDEMTTEIEVVKIWDDNNDQDGQRPDEVRFTLVGTIADKIVSEISKTLSNASKRDDNTWTVAFEGVDKKKDVKVITYKVVEQMHVAMRSGR